MAPRNGTKVSRYFYGQDPSQFADLHLPGGTPHPGVVVLFHGGWWGPNYGSDHLAAAASDLAGRGWVTWNVEYRRIGLGGGYPTTLQDAAAAIDYLATLDDVDTARVVAIGHSAGGHLATWSAGRAQLPPGAPGAPGALETSGASGSGPRVELTGAISLAGVLDLSTAARERLGQGAALQFMAATPDEQPERYSIADPLARVPISVAMRCVHAPADDRVPFTQSVTYVNAARAAGQDAQLIEVEGDHFTVAAPSTPTWPSVIAALEALIDA
jgi:acetyl esterase/lipase